MKKILVLVPNLNLPGGVSNYYSTLKLNEEDHIQYFNVNKSKPQSNVATMFRVIANYWKFFILVIRKHYSVIHLNPSLDRKSFFRDSGFIIISRLLNRKIIVFFRGWKEPFEEKIKKSRFKTFVFKISYAKADTFIVLSQLFKIKLNVLGVPAKTKFFIETTVADSLYLNEFDLTSKQEFFQKAKVFLFLSRIEKEKGIYTAIDAFEQFLTKEKGNTSRMIIAGDGSELAAAKKYVADKKIPSIYFTGTVMGDEKKKVLFDSHIMIFPSHSEGLPNCILEGMLYGMPIISRPVGGIPDVIHQGLNGYLSESLEPGMFSDFLVKLASDTELYQKISLTNHRVALEKYTSEKVKERILRIYETFDQ